MDTPDIARFTVDLNVLVIRQTFFRIRFSDFVYQQASLVLASQNNQSKLCFSFRLLLRFELKLTYTLGLGIVKINSPSALNFCYICPDGHIYAWSRHNQSKLCFCSRLFVYLQSPYII